MNVKYAIVKTIVKLYFLGALAISFTHIIAASHKLALYGWQSWTTPFAIDGIAVIGMVMRSEAFSSATRRLGFRVQITAGLLSLACNVFAGNTIGERVYGAMIVGLFVFSEWLSDRMESREAEEAQLKAAKRVAATEKAKVTRAANVAKKTTRKPTAPRRSRVDAELAAMVAGELPANAPVSPAPIA